MLNGTCSAVGSVRSSGTLQGTTLCRLTLRGIPSRRALASWILLCWIFFSWVLLSFARGSTLRAADGPFYRGDCNGLGVPGSVVDLSDAAAVIDYLRAPGTFAPPCLDACDANDDGQVDYTDAAVIAKYLVEAGPFPPPPGPQSPGMDPTQDALGCAGGPPWPDFGGDSLPPVVFACGSRELDWNGEPVGTLQAFRGSTVEVWFHMKNPGSLPAAQASRIEGFTMALAYACYLEVGYEDLQIYGGTILETLGAEYVAANADNYAYEGDGCEMVIAVLIDASPPFDGRAIPPSDEFQLLGSVDFHVRPDAICGEVYPIVFTDGVNGAGIVPAMNAVSAGGRTRQVEFRDCEVVALDDPRFFRGDCNFSGGVSDWPSSPPVDIADAAALISFLFLSGPLKFHPPCLDACDVDDDGLIDLSDATSLLRYLFQKDALFPPQPGPGLRETPGPNPWSVEPTAPGPDPTWDSLDCRGGLVCGGFGAGPGDPPAEPLVFSCGSAAGPTVLGLPGAPVPVDLFIRNPDIPGEGRHPQGFAMALTYACDLQVAKEELDVRGTILESLGAEYVSASADNDAEDGDGCQLVVGVLLDAVPPFDGRGLPHGEEPLKVGSIEFRIRPDAPCGRSYPIEFVDGVNGTWKVPAFNVVSAANFSERPLVSPCGVFASCGGDADADGDGLPDAEELRLGTDPQDFDSDDDGLPDGFEAQRPACLDPLDPADATLDCDGDHATNFEEFLFNTDPEDPLSAPVWGPENVRGSPVENGIFLQWDGPGTGAVAGFRVRIESASGDGGGVEEAGSDGGGAQSWEYEVPAGQDYFVASGLPAGRYQGQVYTWDFAGKEYPAPSQGFHFNSTPAMLPVPRPVLEHPIVLVPGTGTECNSASYGPLKAYLEKTGLFYGGSFCMETSEMGGDPKPVLHGPGGALASIFDVSFHNPCGHPDEQGEELAEVLDAIWAQRGAGSSEKAILIAHSLGGLSARTYVQSPSLYNQRMDVEKLITIGTPHRGVFPDHQGFPNASGVWDMIAEEYANDTSSPDRYECYSWCAPQDDSCKVWREVRGRIYVKAALFILKYWLDWDFEAPDSVLVGDTLFAGSSFLTKLNNSDPGDGFSTLPRNVDYHAIVGKTGYDGPIMKAGFMNTFLRNCPDEETTCTEGCATKDGGDGFISAWSQDLSLVPAAASVSVAKKVYPLNHGAQSGAVESFLEAIGFQSVVFRALSPVTLAVTDPQGRKASRYLWEIPGAFVSECDIDGDGEMEEEIRVFAPMAGAYEVTVAPKPGAPPDATYSLEVEMNGQTNAIVEGRKVSEISPLPETVSVNTRPVAVIVAPETVYVPEGAQTDVTLDGSGSFDIDGDPIAYSWTYPGGTSTQGIVSLSLGRGTHEVSLKVNDGVRDSELKRRWISIIERIRGDANGDGKLDISDPVALLGCLFLGTVCPEGSCASDANDDGTSDISDAIFILEFLFLGGREPRPCE